MPRKPIQIDRDKLRAAVRKLGNDYVFYMLNDAIELLPLTKLHKIAKSTSIWTDCVQTRRRRRDRACSLT